MLENHLLISTSNNMIELLPRHPPLLRSYITFNSMSPVTFDGSGQVPIDYYYPVCYPRSSNRPDPNDARLLLLNHSADLNQKNKYIYPWQSPSWTLNVWGQYILNTRLSGSHGGSTEPDSLNKDVHSLDHPPRMTTKKRLRDDEKTRIANIMGTIKTPRDSLGLRIQLDPIQAQSTRYTNLMSSTSKDNKDTRIVSGQRADDILPPSTEHVRALMRSQARHLRIAMQSSKELERAWKRVQLDMMGHGVGNNDDLYGHIINLGDGDMLAELKLSNQNLRYTIDQLKIDLLNERRKNSSSSSGSSSGSSSSSNSHIDSDHVHALRRMRDNLQRMDDAVEAGSAVILTHSARSEMLKEFNRILEDGNENNRKRKK
jgi:hypothetical protein